EGDVVAGVLGGGHRVEGGGQGLLGEGHERFEVTGFEHRTELAHPGDRDLRIPAEHGRGLYASAVVVDEVDVGRVDSGFLREQCERQRVVTGGGDGDLLRVVLQRIDQRVEVVEVPVLGRHDHEVLDVEGGD